MNTSTRTVSEPPEALDSAGITAWLDEAQAKADAATEGPWEAFRDDRRIIGVGQEATDVGVFEDRFVRDADAAFIADARTRLPHAAAALRAVLELATLHPAEPVHSLDPWEKGYKAASRDARAAFLGALSSALGARS